jgi:3-oxoacyl-[acyl-carrier-protein] synthase-1
MQELEEFLVELESLDREPLIACPIEGLTDGYVALGRWTRLASAALSDLLDNSSLSRDDLAAVRLYLGLPQPTERHLGLEIGENLGKRIGEWLDVPQLVANARTYPEGNAAAILALTDAIMDLQAGAVRFAVVGGVDSLIELESLDVFLEARRLKTGDNVDGFIPGEAAAFILLETVGHAAERSATFLATLEAPATAREVNTIWGDEPVDGTGLSAAIRATLSALDDGGSRTGLIVCDLNGETYRAKEYATACPRVLSSVQTPWELWHPADSIGETGAASPLVGACLVAQALAQEYAPSENALVWASSDNGLRGSFYLRSHS